MKAFVHRIDEKTGRDCLGTGMNAGMVTNEYRSRRNMERYFLSKLPLGRYHVEVFYSWANCFRPKADLDFVYLVAPQG